MTFSGVNFLDVARLLLQQGPDEACERSSISRAYYAAFHGARDYCESAGTAIVRNNAHVEVRWCLESTGQDLIADDLRRLHIWRKHADYDVLAPLEDFPDVARSALAMAESILDC